MQHVRRRSTIMHPLDLSPKSNLSHFKTYNYSGDLKNISRNLSQLHHSDKNCKLAMCTFGNKREKDQGKRGRPRADLLTSLMVEGSSSRSKIRCPKCSRVFPREKSLQAHLRTHTGERPYPCDFPGCPKAFCQSGQLKTHQRLHTGEKPFVCNVEGCKSRFTHANRHCSTHPNAGLKRIEVNIFEVAEQLNQDLKKSPEKEWLERYIRRCKERLNPKESNDKEHSYKSSMVPLDMSKRGSTSPKTSTKRRGSTTISLSPNNKVKSIHSALLKKEEHKERVLAVSSSPPRLTPLLSVSTSRLSPMAFTVTPPIAHQSSMTLTPLTPRHPGSASSSDTSISTLSASPSPFTSSTAVRDLSSFMQSPLKSSTLHSISIEKPSFTLSSYTSPMVLDHTSYSPYYGQVFPPPPPPLTLSPIQTSREISYNIPTPGKSDKDRYISALALIELSKG